MTSLGRRQLVVIISALAMVLIGAGVVGGLVAATQSEGGREWIRAQASRELNRGLRGRLHLGKLSGSFLTDITVDSIELRGPEDSVFLAAGRVSLRYDPRDIVDGRFIFRSVEADHPFIVIRKELDESWNYKKVFPPGPDEGKPKPNRRRGAFGSLMLFHDVRVKGGEIRLTKPWSPADSLKGAKRDSAIAYNLADTYNDIRRVNLRGRRGFQKTWRWKDMDAVMPYIRFRHPDSTGRRFELANLDVNETVPPFNIRGMVGGFLWRGDTVWFDMPRFSLPNSTGGMKGKIEWPTGDTFWDVRVTSDSTAMEDIHWIYPTLPRVGHGSMLLHIKTKPDNREVTDYAITKMDLRSAGSRLRGDMTYRVGGPVLEVRDVNLSLEPADFTLLETLNGVPFPYPWRGTLTGNILASGGPVNRFQVERADLFFTDRNVPGATAKGVGRGELDILFPAFAKFHGFRLDLDHFDLRTGQFLNPLFPRLNGYLSGTAILDSVWTDVRLREGDFTHRDGDDTPPTQMRGAGRITLGDDFVSVDLTAAALPLSASTLAKSYPMLPLRGEFRGPLRAQGTIADLAFSTDLVGEAGRVQVDGRFDGFEPGYRGVARGSVSGFDIRRGFGLPKAPESALDARFVVDIAGDSLHNLTGTAQVTAERSMFDGVRLFGGQAALRFVDGAVQVDSARLESTAGLLTARGALGLVPSVSEALRFQYAGDSLGGLRRYLARVAAPGATAAADSLEGTLRAAGQLTGHIGRFALDATVDGTELLLRTTSARQLRGTVALSSLPDSATGALTLRLDRLRSGTVTYNDVSVRADVLRGNEARASATLTAPMGTGIRGVGDLRRRGDTTFVRLDTLVARTVANEWTLRRPALIATSGGGFRLDTLVLAGARGGTLNATGRTNSLDTVAIALRADSVPLADVGEIMQAASPMSGVASLRADVRGTRSRPDFFFTGSLNQARVAGLRLDRLDVDGRYAERRLTAALGLGQGSSTVLHADAALPIDLAFEPAGSRLIEEPMVARVRADSASLAVLESFLPSVRDASGLLRLDIDVGGTWRHPRATGSASISGGSMQLREMGQARVEGLDADIGFLGDSIVFRRFTARSGAARSSSASISGTLGFRDAADATFGVRLDLAGFNVFRDPRVADLDLTGNLLLSGRRSAATLSGGFTVDRGEIRLPELYQKRLISLDDPNLYRVVDTTALVNRALLASGDTVFMNNLTVRNLPIRMGNDVWLRSEEADINLGGFVSVTRTRPDADGRGGRSGRAQLVLEGPLQTVRGTYRLNLGPVQRTFTVESGDVRFYGDPDLNAALNINAGYVVRQVAQQGARPDVRVHVRIGGTRLSPTLELSTPDSARVTTADLISYLTTGGPSNAISGRGGDYTSTATRFLLTSVGSVLGGQLSGGLCDDAQLSTAGLDAYQGRLRGFSGQVLQSTRFNCAKQLTDRLFVRVDAGLCQVGRLVDGANSSASTAPIGDTFGAKLDYRVRNDFTLSVGVEPPTSALYCRDDAGARGFAPTPRQVGFDLFRLWRF